jgi:hypothetical protein
LGHESQPVDFRDGPNTLRTRWINTSAAPDATIVTTTS